MPGTVSRVLIRALVRARLLGRPGADGSLALPARFALRLHGYTPASVELEMTRRAVPGDVLFGGLDAAALRTIGIDLGTVRARIESSFGPDVLDMAARAAGWPGTGQPGRRRGRRPIQPRPGRLVRLRQAHPELFDEVIADVISGMPLI
ncbi:MAG: hypothetical protein ACLPKI_12830 [Streptosporangiaceae bacterium]